MLPILPVKTVLFQFSIEGFAVDFQNLRRAALVPFHQVENFFDVGPFDDVKGEGEDLLGAAGGGK
ncbi:MAG TPA: hypothetical protein VK187_02925 [Geobacteraceae bacterium]|nr:hypothetical protein [Geobacteraceae bacterium]